MGKQRILKDGEGGLSLMANNPEEYKRQGRDNVLHKPIYADLYESLDNKGKEQLDGFFRERNIIENMMEQEEEKLKAQKEAQRFVPKNEIEQDLSQQMSTEEYQEFKRKQEELDQLSKKTYTYKRAELQRKGDAQGTFTTDINPEDSNWINVPKATWNGLVRQFGAMGTFLGAAGDHISDYFNNRTLTEKEKRRYDELNNDINRVQEPVLKSKLAQLEEKEKQFLAKYSGKKDYNTTAEELYLKGQVLDNFDKMKQRYQDAIEGKGFWAAASNNGLNSVTLGLYDLGDNMKTVGLLNKLKENGYDSLTDLEKELVKSNEDLNHVESQRLNNNSLYSLGESVRDSVVFMGEMLLTERLTGGAGTAANALLKGSSRGVKAIAGVAGEASKAFISPSTYNTALEKIASTAQFVYDDEGNRQIVFGDGKKRALVNDYKNNLKIANAQLAKLEKDINDTNDPAQKETLQEQYERLRSKAIVYSTNLNELVDDEGRLREEEVSLGDAAILGLTENIKERFSERYVGHVADKFIPAIGSALGRGIAKIPGAGKIATNTVDNVSRWMANNRKSLDDILFRNQSLGTLSKAFSNHVGGARVLHSLPAEMIEEIAVQLTPTYQADFVEQLNELSNPEFYTQVLASSLIIGGTPGIVGGLAHATKYKTDKQYRAEYDKYVKDKRIVQAHYKALDNAINDEEVAQNIAMSTIGTIFQAKDYEATIADLRNPDVEDKKGRTQEDRNRQADLMEKNSFINMAIQSVATGTESDFKNVLSRMTRNGDLSEETRLNATNAVGVLDEIVEASKSYSGQVNYGTVMKYKINDINYKQAINELDKNINRLRPLVDVDINEYNRYNGIEENKYSLDSISDTTLSEDEDLNNYMAELRDANLPEVNEYLDNIFTKNVIERFAYDNRQNLKYELNPQNASVIRQRELEKLREDLTSNTTKDNVTETKEVLKEKGIDDSATIASVNKQAIADSTEEVVNQPKADEADSHIPTREQYQMTEKEASDTSSIFEDVEGMPSGREQGIASEDTITPFDGLEVEEPDVDYSEMTPEERATMEAYENGLAAPVLYDPTDEKQSSMIDKLKGLYGNMKKKQPEVSFEGMLASFFNDPRIGALKIDKYFDIMRNAWNESTGDGITREDGIEKYNKFFPSAELVDEASQVFGGSVVISTPTLPTYAIKQSDKAGESNQTEYNPEQEVETNIEYAPHTVRKYAGIGLKLGGVLGLNYEDVDTYEERVTTSELVNDTAKPFMDWRNFRPGSKMDFTFHMDYLLDENNSLPIWDNLDALYESPGNDRPVKRQVSVKNRLVDLFKSDPNLNSWDRIVAAINSYKNNPTPDNPLFANEEFLKIVPIGILNNGLISDNNADGTPADRVLLGGLNDYYWFNNYNVALRVDNTTGKPLLAERATRINKNREINLEARKAILSNGGLQVTISEQRDAKNNTRLLKTEEEKAKGYTDIFYSVISQFGNNIEEFNKNATLAFIDPSNNLIGSVDNSGNKVLAKINGKSITKDKIINYNNYFDNAKKQNFTNGRTAFIHIAGLNEDGSPYYVMHDIINNHTSRQQDFAKQKAILDQMYFKLSSLDNDTESQKANKKVLQKAFKDQFGYEFTKGIKRSLESVYPTNFFKGTKTDVYRQDYNAEAMTPGQFDLVPDLTMYDNADQLLTDLANGTPITSVNKKELVLRNLHTNLVFTPIDKNGEKIYSVNSQPIMMFDFKSNIEVPNQKEIIAETKQRLETRKEYLEAQIDSSNNEQEKGILGKELKEVKKEITKTNIASAVAQTIEESPVSRKNNGEEVDFGDEGRNTTIDELIARAFSSIDVSKPFSVQDLYNTISTEFNNIVAELEQKGMISEANFIKANRESILGIGQYEDSIREQINTLLDITEIEEFLDLTGENVKDFEANSYEIDVTKSLSFKVKMLLSGIKDPRSEEGFAGFKDNLSWLDSLESLHQVLSDSNNNSLESIRPVIQEKIKKNPIELSFYNQILERLETINTTNPEVVNEILYSLFQPKVQMRFVMWNMNRNGSMTLENYDANVKNPLFIKRNNWTEGLKTNGLVDLYEGNLYKINPVAFKEVNDLHESIFNAYNQNKKVSDVNRNDLSRLLKKYGITLNNKTLDNTYEELSQNDLDLVVKLFDGNNSILKVINDNIKTAFESETTLSFDTPDARRTEVKRFNPITYRNSQINDLINADNFVEFIPMGTMYLAGKTVNMYQQQNAITKKVRSLKDSLREYIANMEDENVAPEDKMTGIIKRFNNSPITSNSYLLGLMQRNPIAASKYLDTFLISLEALKEGGTKSRDDMGITELSDKDNFITLMGMFASSEGEFTDREIDAKYDKKIKLRKGVINFPTISDSSQLPFLKTILINMSNENVDTENDQLDETILSIMRDQLLVSDLKRIADYLVNVGDSSSNIDGYDAGAIWITGIPSLNTAQIDYTYEVNGEQVTHKRPLVYVFREMIKSDPSKNNEDDIQNFIDQHIETINEEINNSVSNEVNKLISVDGKSGDFIDFELIGKNKIILSDNKANGYFENKSPRLVAYDYVVNYMLQQKEIQTLFAGDLAQYFKNKMAGNLENGLPKIKFEDASMYFYSSEADIDRIEEITQGKKVSNLSNEAKQTLLQEYPLLKYTDELITSDINHEEAYQALLPVASAKVAKMFKDVQNNLSKRLKGQISPGNQRMNSKYQSPYMQIMVSDVENASQTFEDLVKRAYPNKYESLLKPIQEFKKLDAIYERTEDQEANYNRLKSEISKEVPSIAAYLKTTSTDAQEYTSWKENLDQLRDQGRLMPEEYELLKAKLEAQSKDLLEGNYIKEENKLTPTELKMAIMQPTKPLYAGMVDTDINGHNMQRFVYIKSSSFPLLPEMTQMFPKLNNLRKNVESLEDKNKTIVRVSYQSGVKVGSVKKPVNVAELYKENPNFEAIEKSSLILPRDNFYIQQDKPFKSDKNAKNGKVDTVTRATQFEKIILGDGINKMGAIFPSNMFDTSLLSNLGVTPNEDGNITGADLKKIYNGIYAREQKILSDKLFNKLGITSYNDINEGRPEAMENLARLLNKRLSNKQDKKALELLYEVEEMTEQGFPITRTLSKQEIIEKGLTPRKAYFKIPLFMTPNSRKFESVLNSIINKNNINLNMPGFSFPVASQEGFDYQGYSEEYFRDLIERGLITTPNFDPEVGLKSTRDESTGKIKYAQVFLANKYKVYNKETGKYDYINLKEYIDENNQVDLNKIPEDLLSLFSFRIPTSSHQSGTVIEVAGFLPHNMGDLMIVPRDHTVQIGEDYDIDVRYAYQYNFIKDANGNLKKLEYADLEAPGKSLAEFQQEFQNKKTEIWNTYFETTSNVDVNDPLNKNNFKTALKNPYWKSNQEKVMEILFLQEALDHYAEDKLWHAIFQDQYEIDEFTPEFLRDRIALLEEQLIPKDVVASTQNSLKTEYRNFIKELNEDAKYQKAELINAWKTYRNAFTQKVNENKVLENGLVSMYKSVYSSTNADVQNLITKVLSTDFSEDSASAIDSRLSQLDPNFNIYSPSVQRKVMKLGADGKMGIGVHSNAVTINSLLQQLDKPLQFYSTYLEDQNMYLPYDIKLGKNTFTGSLGSIKDKSKRISEYLMESQNSSTDNQKLEIMGRRNENTETISVFSLLQMTGMEDDGLKVRGQSLSYASLFISQPILLDYVKTVKNYKSSTDKSFGNPEFLAETDIQDKYSKLVPSNYWSTDEDGNAIVGRLNREAIHQLGNMITSPYLYSEIRPIDKPGFNAAAQYYIFQKFLELKRPARELQSLQQFVNIENGGLGVSYFDTIALKDMISNIDSLKIRPEDAIAVKLTEDVPNSLFSEMFGDYRNILVTDLQGRQSLINDGYIYITSENGISTLVKPNNHYSHKIMNSISLGYNLWNALFPYDNKYINKQIDDILSTAGVNPNTKRATELKYDIVSNMKDYSYTNSKRLFDNNIGQYQKELFFDDKEIGQESLGSYLLKLKDNPSYKYLFRLPFFKDLQISVGQKNTPTIIKYNTGDMSPLNNLKMYNKLDSLVNSEKELPAKLNGKSMTESSLMRDILAYSLIADQGNGAIGFRQFLPLSLFEKYQVDAMLRNVNEVNKNMLNFTYNGPLKSAEAFLGTSQSVIGVIRNINNVPYDAVKSFTNQLNMFTKSQSGIGNVFKITSAGDIINTMATGEVSSSIFVRQYFQHNPDKVANPISYSEKAESRFGELLSSNNISNEDFLAGKMNTFMITATAEKPAKDFMVIKNIDGVPQLFEKFKVDPQNTNDIVSYRRITTLGMFGFNEYQAGRNVNVSKVGLNNYQTDEVVVPVIEASEDSKFNNRPIQDIVKEILSDNYEGTYSDLIKLIRELVPSLDNVSVIESETLRQGTTALYRNVNGIPTIEVSKSFLSNPKTTEKQIQNAVMEEMLHHVTVSTISNYGQFSQLYLTKSNVTGDDTIGVKFEPNKDANGNNVIVPAPLQTLLNVYMRAVQHYANKFGAKEFLDKIQEYKSDSTSAIELAPGISEAAYRATNVHEFVAGIFIKDTDFAKEMANTPYLKSGKSILAKFSEALMKLMSRIIPGAKKDSITANTASGLFEFLVQEKNLKTIVNSTVIKKLPTNTSQYIDKADFFESDVPNREEGVVSSDVTGFDELFGEQETYDFTKETPIVLNNNVTDPNHREDLDLEINKDKKDYKLTRRAIGNGGQYSNVYAKNITIPGFEEFEFAVYKNESNIYVGIEKSTGLTMGQGDYTIKGVISNMKDVLDRKGIDALREAVENSPKIQESAPNIVSLTDPITSVNTRC